MKKLALLIFLTACQTPVEAPRSFPPIRTANDTTPKPAEASVAPSRAPVRSVSDPRASLPSIAVLATPAPYPTQAPGMSVCDLEYGAPTYCQTRKKRLR